LIVWDIKVTMICDSSIRKISNIQTFCLQGAMNRIRDIGENIYIFIKDKSLWVKITLGVVALFAALVAAKWFISSLFWFFGWCTEWTRMNGHKKIFEDLIKYEKYDEKIIGMKEFELYTSIKLVNEESDSGGFIPYVSKNKIFFEGEERYEWINKALPYFFIDVEWYVSKAYCVQGRVRKKNPDSSYGKFEDKFFVVYENRVNEESKDAFDSRLDLLKDKEKEKREREKIQFPELVESHSSLITGNCPRSFQGWIKKI
jgi:hypothetical protein